MRTQRKVMRVPVVAHVAHHLKIGPVGASEVPGGPPVAAGVLWGLAREGVSGGPLWGVGVSESRARTGSGARGPNLDVGPPWGGPCEGLPVGPFVGGKARGGV